VLIIDLEKINQNSISQANIERKYLSDMMRLAKDITLQSYDKSEENTLNTPEGNHPATIVDVIILFCRWQAETSNLKKKHKDKTKRDWLQTNVPDELQNIFLQTAEIMEKNDNE